MRRSFAVLAVAAMALAVMCGAAFADASSVVQKVNDYGLKGAASGSTVTITGEKLNATTTLDLGDISGLVIDWQATLTYTPGKPAYEGHEHTGDPIGTSHVLIAQNNGGAVFKMTDGKIEILPSDTRPQDKRDHEVWILGGMDDDRLEEVQLLGGEIIGHHPLDAGFLIGIWPGSQRERAVLKLDGATVKLASAIHSDYLSELIKGDTSKVSGVVIVGNEMTSEEIERITVDVFGKKSFGDILVKNKDRDMSAKLIANADAEVDFEGANMTGGKLKLSSEVYGTIDIRGMTGTIVDITINAGGEAIIAKDSKVTMLGGTVKRVALAGSGVSAAAAGESGKLMVQGSLTIPDGGKLTIEDIASLTKDPSATLDVKGKIDLPSGTSAEQMKDLAAALGITGSVFEMNGKTYNDQGEETTSGGGSSSGACTTGAAAVAIAALAIIKRRNK